jgi:hypothetical protein
LRILKDNSLKEKIGKAAHETVQNHFLMSRELEQLIDLERIRAIFFSRPATTRRPDPGGKPKFWYVPPVIPDKRIGAKRTHRVFLRVATCARVRPSAKVE